MLMPSTFRNNVFDDLFGAPFFAARSTDNMMKTDIKENDAGYELTVDLPGIKKEDVKAELNDGYLTISAESSTSNDEKDDKGRYICRERYSGSYSRSFDLTGVDTDHISAEYKNGVLEMVLPKQDGEQPACRRLTVK